MNMQHVNGNSFVCSCFWVFDIVVYSSFEFRVIEPRQITYHFQNTINGKKKYIFNHKRMVAI